MVRPGNPPVTGARSHGRHLSSFGGEGSGGDMHSLDETESLSHSSEWLQMSRKMRGNLRFTDSEPALAGVCIRSLWSFGGGDMHSLDETESLSHPSERLQTSRKTSNPTFKGSEPTTELTKMIEKMLHLYGVADKTGLPQQILSFATDSIDSPGEHFRPVDRVPKSADWGSIRHFNKITMDEKLVYIWIVGIVSSCSLHGGDDQVHPKVVSVEVKPFAKSIVDRAEKLLARYRLPGQSQQCSRDVILVARTMANEPHSSRAKPFRNVFDARMGYDSRTKLDPAKKLSSKEIGEGDVVLVEALLSRTRLSVVPPQSTPEASAAPSEQAYDVSFKLVDIILLAKGKSPKEDSADLKADRPDSKTGKFLSKIGKRRSKGKAAKKKKKNSQPKESDAPP